uniref:Protein CUSTOS n=1 Tax=Amblyomma cajennense TaxID=34607 RepID=A0A023FR64_AMBCJ
MSDSSSDESDERLREAVVTAKDIVNKKPQKCVQESLDASNDHGTSITDLSLECRQYLAKSLSNSLDKHIKIVDRQVDVQDYDESLGIKLFTDSTVELVEVEEPEVERPRKKHKKSKEKVTDDMLAAVAVTPEWVLKQSGIHGAHK